MLSKRSQPLYIFKNINCSTTCSRHVSETSRRGASSVGGGGVAYLKIIKHSYDAVRKLLNAMYRLFFVFPHTVLCVACVSGAEVMRALALRRKKN